MLKINEEIPILIGKGLNAKQISEELQISTSALFRALKKLNLHIPNYHNELKFDNTVFDNIDTEEKAYWLGFLYADGNVSTNSNVVSVSLSRKDIDHLNKFNIFIKNKIKTRETITKTNNKQYETCNVSICDKHLKERLVELGCVPQKSLILKFPNINIFSNPYLVYDFIRGYVDGDGCLTFSKNGRLGLNILGTKEFLEGIQDCFPNKFTIHKIKRLKTNVWALRNCGENADYVSTILYKGAKIYLERKYNRFVVLCRNT